MVPGNLASFPPSMDQNNDQRAHTHPFHGPSYPMVPQVIPTSSSVGGPLFHAPHQSHLQLSSHTLPLHPQQHLQFNSMNFPNMRYSATSSHLAYNNPGSLPMVPHFPLQPGPNTEAVQYYHPPPFPHFHPSGFMPSYPPQGFAPFVTRPPFVDLSQPPPYHHLPSPVESTAASVASTGFSNPKDVSSPKSTAASPTIQNMTRTSPVIARTPQRKISEDEVYPEIMTPTSTDFGEEGGPVNIYIKGLPETTTDKQLRELVEPFGVVVSSKAIIDRPSGVCKGYGFAKFTTVEAATACIADLKSKDYEATFAKDSFYSKLKDLADLDSTNLYVSNLPTNWNEARIIEIFPGYNISKCRLLFTQRGQSRGVAFVTFESRDICDEIIEKFNGIHLKEEGHHLRLQVRYADTIAQKNLKKEKQAVGQFPKKSVLLNHQQTLQKGKMLSNAMGELSLGPSTPLHQKGWSNSGALPVNAPPTPPRSVISAEEDSLKSE